MVSTKDKVRARVRPLPHREREYTVVRVGGVGRGRTHHPRVLGGCRSCLLGSQEHGEGVGGGLGPGSVLVSSEFEINGGGSGGARGSNADGLGALCLGFVGQKDEDDEVGL